ncbi:MAG: aminotransferase class III-fold pyridoxal phosphate-dependent enzyme [Lysobacterales bacterium]
MSRILGGRNAPIPYGPSYPKQVVKCEGPYVYDAGGSRYVDLWMGFGSLPLGHADERFINSVVDTAKHCGLMHSYAHPLEESVADLLCSLLPSADSVRFALTGQEATGYCARLARAATGRERLLLVEGGYHGVNDATSYRSPAGIPRRNIELVTRIKHNDVDRLKIELRSGEFAAFMVEPVLGNDGVRPCSSKFLSIAREECTKSGTVLVFDEVMTGFRKDIGCAQSDYGICPDLTATGKALGGGVPISAICGADAIMRGFVPYGQVAQEGTYYGSPLSLAASNIALRTYVNEDVPKRISSIVDDILRPLRQWNSQERMVEVSSYGGMFSIRFDVDQGGDGAMVFSAFSRNLAARGILLPPVASESAFVSVAHANLVEMLGEEILVAAQAAVAEWRRGL